MDKVINKRRFVITLDTRLITGFMALSVPLLILIMLLLPKVNSVIELTHKIHRENLPPILDSQIYQTQDILEHWAMTGDPKDKIYFAHVWNEITHVRAQWNQVISQIDDPALYHKWVRLQKLYMPFYQAQASIFGMPRDPNNPDNVENSRKKTRSLEKSMINLIEGSYSEEVGKRIGGLLSDLAEEIERNVNKIDNDLIALKNSAFWLLILAFVLSLVVPYTTRRAIAKPVDKAIEVAERIAAGARNVVIEIQSKDQYC